MVVSDSDRAVVEWARDRDYTHYYCYEPALADSCLRVHIGQITASFRDGQLLRLTAQVDHDLLADAILGLRDLLRLCCNQGFSVPSIENLADC